MSIVFEVFRYVVATFLLLTGGYIFAMFVVRPFMPWECQQPGDLEWEREMRRRKEELGEINAQGD